MQFHLQKLLSDGLKLASETPQNWKDLVVKTGRVEMLLILTKLIECVGDASALLCLALAALTIEDPSKGQK